MTTIKMMLAAAVCVVPVAFATIPAKAASAHNIQHGTSTKNTNDSMGTAMMKQHRHHRHMRHHRRPMHKM